MKKRIAAWMTAALMLSCAAFAELPAPSAVEAQADNASAEMSVTQADSADAAQTAAVEATDAAAALETPVATPGTQSAVTTATDGGISALNALPDPEKVVEMTGQADGETHMVWFEEGFGLSIPEGWVSYPVSEEDRAKGVRYALGDGSDSHYLYIQFDPTDIRTAEALAEAVDGEEGITRTGSLMFGDADFVAFIDSVQNASCCATLWGDQLVIFAFTPQTDPDYMLTATQLMESFVTA